jgi:hypothetical protein
LALCLPDFIFPELTRRFKMENESEPDAGKNHFIVDGQQLPGRQSR